MGIPNTEAALPSYVTNFSAKFTAAPAVYHATGADALALADAVSNYLASQTALVAAREAGVRSEVLRVARDTAKDELMPTLRSWYGQIQKDNTVPDEAKTEIGVHIPKTTRTTVPAPTDRPGMEIVSVYDRTIAISIHDTTAGSRASRPKRAAQALVYYFAGEDYPSDPNGWSFAGVATERKFTFTVPETVAGGTRMWVCAAYTNRKGDPGPTNVPISTAIQGGGSVVPPTELKIAA